jgi:hypothetical protein
LPRGAELPPGVTDFEPDEVAVTVAVTVQLAPDKVPPDRFRIPPPPMLTVPPQVVEGEDAVRPAGRVVLSARLVKVPPPELDSVRVRVEVLPTAVVVGLKLAAIVGGVTKVYWSLALVALVPPTVVTVTSTVPAA